MTEEYRKNVKELCVTTYGWSEKESEERTNEFFDKFIVTKKYLKDYNGTICSPSEITDKVWRVSLLFTMKYRLMCGDNFIEYEPVNFSQQKVEKPSSLSQPMSIMGWASREDDITIFDYRIGGYKNIPGAPITQEEAKKRVKQKVNAQLQHNTFLNQH